MSLYTLESNLWQWNLLCSVSQYSTNGRFTGTLTLYCNICFPLKAAATSEITLNVFLLFAFPVDALKFPRVPITESELLMVIIMGGSKNSSVILTMALSSALAVSWLSGIIIYLLCFG